MTTVKEIEKAISDLPPVKFSVLRSWFEKLDATRWDKQFERDVKNGKLNAVAAKTLTNFKKAKCNEI